MEKMKAYKLQEDGLDTVDANLHLGHQADERDYGVGAQILRHIGVTKMRLMSNNPVKCVGLEAYGLEVVENVPIEVKPNPYNEFYMKRRKNVWGMCCITLNSYQNVARIPIIDYFCRIIIKQPIQKAMS